MQIFMSFFLKSPFPLLRSFPRFIGGHHAAKLQKIIHKCKHICKKERFHTPFSSFPSIFPHGLDAMSHFIYQHFASLAVKTQCQFLTITKTQIARFLVFRIRIGLTAVPEFKQQAVFARHQTICHWIIFHLFIGLLASPDATDSTHLLV